MATKEQITVYKAGTEINDYPADADFTTDAIEWADFKGYTLNIWFPTLNGGNPKPTIEFQASNSTDLSSFTTYENINNFSLPDLFEDEFFTPKYIRFVYTSTNVGGGSTVTFNLNKNTL